MERLTIDTDTPFCDIAQCDFIPGGSLCEDGRCDQRRCYERLREYERTGITPEDLKRVFNEDAILKLAGQVLGVEPSSLRGTAPRWISVADRLPETGVPVIVCREGGKVEQGAKDVMDWWRVYGTRTKRVTHWMPLPEPPKEEDDG